MRCSSLRMLSMTRKAASWVQDSPSCQHRKEATIAGLKPGSIMGAGLSLMPTPYRFEVQGRVLFTWCALDTLIFPVWLGHSAQVSSACPVTGTPIHLRVSPGRLEHLDPPSGVMSLIIQDRLASCCNIRV